MATFVKLGIDSEEIKFKHSKKHIEVAIVRIFGQNKNLDIVNFYTPGTKLVTSGDYIEIYSKLGANSVFLGDFNARHESWDSNYVGNLSRNSEELIEFLNATDYIVLNDGSGTRLNPTNGTTSALDLTFATASMGHKCDWQVHEDTLGSDHFPILLSVNASHKHVDHRPQQRWKLTKADWALFKDLTANISFNDKNNTVNECNSIFIDKILEASELAIPKTKTSKTAKKVLPWWDEICSDAVRKKHKTYYKFKKYRTDALLEQFRQARNECKFILNSVKKQKWEEFISTLTFKTNSKIVWDTFKKFKGKSSRPVEVIKVENVRYHENSDKAEILAKHYQNVSSNASLTPTFRDHKNEQEPRIDRLVGTNTGNGEHLVYNTDFTIRELSTALNKKKSTAPGGDTVHYDMLKQLPEKSKFVLLKLLNKSWNEGELPTQWKESTIFPLLKPGKDPHEPQAYRPISLTSVICKVMETMVANRLTAHLENNNYLSNCQSGFRNNRSTIDQIVRLESEIKKAGLEKRILMAVFLDLEKAFDLMWRKGVLQKLVHFGIKGKMLTWIQDFLTGRKIRVRVATEHSDYRETENGSPQGSVLSPILFNLIINTLADELNSHPIKLSLFADDSLIWKTAKKPRKLILYLQNALDAIERWSDEWGFKISASKTSVVIFNRRFSATDLIPRLQYKGKYLDYSKEAKFLGMIFDHNLSWQNHIDNLVKRCQKDINLMKLISGPSFGADKKTLIQFYTALIRSKIDYGSQAYASAPKTHLKKLNTIQATALRIATGAYKGTQNFSLETECNIQPLSKRRDELQLKYWARSNSLGENLPINTLVQPLSLYDLNRERCEERLPYAIRVQDLLTKHELGEIEVESKKFPRKHNLKSIAPRCGLAGVIKKNETNMTECQAKTDRYIRNLYWNAIKVYTDGSKDPVNNRVGCAFVVPSYGAEYKFKLNNNLTVYAAELTAIKQALLWIIDNKPGKVVILTDSLSSIQSISSGKSGTRQDILDEILLLIHNTLKLKLLVNIDWCPAHCNVEGNEIADSAAKSALTLGRPLPTLPSAREVCATMRAKMREEWADDWKKYHGFRHDLDSNLPNKLVQYSESRKMDRIYTRLRLGVNGLRANNVFHGEANPLCEHCGGIEDTDHYLMHCPWHATDRGNMLVALAGLGLTGNITSRDLLTAKSQAVRDILFTYITDTNYDSKI